MRAAGALLCGISFSIRDEIRDSGLDAPIGAMRRKARKYKSRGKMHAQRYARREGKHGVGYVGRSVDLI